jgi:hypothetical protein
MYNKFVEEKYALKIPYGQNFGSTVGFNLR